MPNDLQEFQEILNEAYRSVDDQMAGEDKGWVRLGTSTNGIFGGTSKTEIITRSRYYAQIDPLATQALRLWTDYSFGSGLTWKAKSEDESVKNIISSFWNNHANAACLSCAGQRKSSHNLLRDGTIYFAIFLGRGEDAKIRRIDPLEITDTITDPDDADTVLYFRREWTDAQGIFHDDYYRSWQNIKEQGPTALNSMRQVIQRTQDAIVYRLESDPNGLPLLMPALDWIKLYRQFLASRAAIMLALAKFAWRSKVKGGATQVAAVKSKLDQKKLDAGGTIFENDGVDTQPIRTDTGAGNAKTDGDMLKLMICAATGLAIQYFGDVSTGNLATAKTCELPMIKMFESYQAVWEDTYNDIIDIILDAAGVPEGNRQVDWEFPKITPDDAAGIAENIAALIPQLPELGYSDEIMKAALMACGVKDINEALEQLTALAVEDEAKQAEQEKQQAELTKQYLAKGLGPDGQPLQKDTAGNQIPPAVNIKQSWVRDRGNGLKLAKALKEFQRQLPANMRE